MKSIKQTKGKMTASKLEELLSRKEFTPYINELTPEESRASEVIDFENLNYFRYSIEDYREEYGTKKLPTAYIYSEAYLKNAKRILNSKSFRRRTGWSHSYSKALHKAIWNRATRTYISYMVEYHAKLILNELGEGIEVVSNKKLDLKGIDLLIRDFKLGVQVPVHIYKCSSSGLVYRYKKEGVLLGLKPIAGTGLRRGSRGVYKNRVYNSRNTQAHLNLYYQEVLEDNGLVHNVNGYCLLKTAYVLTRYQEFTAVKWVYLKPLFSRI